MNATVRIRGSSAIRERSISTWSPLHYGFFLNWIFILLMRYPIFFIASFNSFFQHRLCFIGSNQRDHDVVRKTMMRQEFPIDPNALLVPIERHHTNCSAAVNSFGDCRIALLKPSTNGYGQSLMKELYFHGAVSIAL
ncbi:hypothetical protein KIN20_012488 [Parelaphostrongylus tenuis]|uniref:Uncharacterized protein n=1 Tax=Parelaphostrongylus tenuis TaxID=148309 RepID=A0AAD5ME99_PARTN|nr:hypothetical protein KIN20_012488 [Parelaphostrongylus tenuis]